MFLNGTTTLNDDAWLLRRGDWEIFRVGDEYPNLHCRHRYIPFEHMQQRHFGMKLLAYTLSNVREFWGA
jgi:hypothetical protein